MIISWRWKKGFIIITRLIWLCCWWQLTFKSHKMNLFIYRKFLQTKKALKVYSGCIPLQRHHKQIIILNNCSFEHLALWFLLRARGEFTKVKLQKIGFKVPNILSRGGLLFVFHLFIYLFNGWFLFSTAVEIHYSII